MDLRLKHVDAETWEYPPSFTKFGVDVDSEIRYSIISGPAYNVDANSITATYVYRINVNDLQNWQYRVRGWASMSDTPGYLARRLPLSDPDDLGLVCVSSNAIAYESMSGIIPATSDRSPFFKDITGRAPATGKLSAVYNYVRLEVVFAAPLYPVLTDETVENPAIVQPGEINRYCTFMETYTAEYVQLDRAVIKWLDGPLIQEKVASGAGIVRSVGELIVTWYRVPSDAVADLRSLWQEMLTTVNLNDFEVPMIPDGDIVTFPAETLLFRPWQLRPQMNGAAGIEYDVEFHWAIRQNPDANGDMTAGWNHFLNPVDGRYYRCGWGAPEGDEPVYQLADHALVFKPGL